MSKALSKLKKLLEAWEQAGDQTEYGKSKDLPKIDYWRRVGGQNIGFVVAQSIAFSLEAKQLLCMK